MPRRETEASFFLLSYPKSGRSALFYSSVILSTFHFGTFCLLWNKNSLSFSKATLHTLCIILSIGFSLALSLFSISLFSVGFCRLFGLSRLLHHFHRLCTHLAALGDTAACKKLLCLYEGSPLPYAWLNFIPKNRHLHLGHPSSFSTLSFANFTTDIGAVCVHCTVPVKRECSSDNKVLRCCVGTVYIEQQNFERKANDSLEEKVSAG